jgi:hypothetical protein
LEAAGADFVAVVACSAPTVNGEITKSAISIINTCFHSIRAGFNVSSWMTASTASIPLPRRRRIIFR